MPFYSYFLPFFLVLKKRPFNISCNTGLVVMDFNFFSSGKLFICLHILLDSFAGSSNLACRSLLYITLNILFQFLLAGKVSFEKSSDSLMGAPLQVHNCFSLAAYKIFSLSLAFCILIMMCLDVGLLGLCCLGLCTSGLVGLFPSPDQGRTLSLFF